MCDPVHILGCIISTFPLPLGAWDGLRYFIVAVPEPSIELFFNYQRNVGILYEIRVLPGQLCYAAFLVPLIFQTQFLDVNIKNWPLTVSTS